MEIRNFLKEKTLIFDGSMGTLYPAVREAPLGKCEMANLFDADCILNIHRQYVEAGCHALKTNTFGANKACLKTDFDIVKTVIQRGYALAAEAARDKNLYVFADIGPIPQTDYKDLYQDYIDIVDVFLGLGAEYFLFETFASVEYLDEISAYIKRRKPNAFIIASFAVAPEGYTKVGFSGVQLFEEVMKIKEIDGFGFNCVSGPYHLLQYLQKFDFTGAGTQNRKYLSIMPNAGYPTVIENRTFFSNSPDYFAEQMVSIVREGANIIGACCGTTPEFIAKTVKAMEKLKHVEQMSHRIKILEKVKAAPIPNRIMDRINDGKKIIAVEFDSPLNADISAFMDGAKKLKEAGVDAITIADCPVARARVDSSILACKLKRELDIDPIPHLTCRDRNINATKALLLGLNIEGVNNILIVTGDPIPTAERDEVKAVFNFNSAILANYIRELNQTVFDNPFNICGALNLNAVNFSKELEKAKRKVDNGVNMLLTQPVLTASALEHLKEAKAALDVKILGGIIPVVSHRNACFMNSEISGITIDEEIIQRYEGIEREAATELAVNISSEIARQISPYVDGYYIITPFKRVDIVTRIIETIL